jgi:hypothetical protein
MTLDFMLLTFARARCNSTKSAVKMNGWRLDRTSELQLTAPKRQGVKCGISSLTEPMQRNVQGILCSAGARSKIDSSGVRVVGARVASARWVGMGRVEKPQIIQSRAYYFHMMYVHS